MTNHDHEAYVILLNAARHTVEDLVFHRLHQEGVLDDSSSIFHWELSDQSHAALCAGVDQVFAIAQQEATQSMALWRVKLALEVTEDHASSYASTAVDQALASMDAADQETLANVVPGTPVLETTSPSVIVPASDNPIGDNPSLLLSPVAGDPAEDDQSPPLSPASDNLSETTRRPRVQALFVCVRFGIRGCLWLLEFGGIIIAWQLVIEIL